MLSALNVLIKICTRSNMYKTGFPTQFYSEWQGNLIKVLSCTFHTCFATFNMLTVELCYETVLFNHLHQVAFPTSSSRKYIRYNDRLFFQNVYNLMEIAEVESKFMRKCLYYFRYLHLEWFLQWFLQWFLNITKRILDVSGQGFNKES